jgi:hypothetical protein
MMRSLKEIIDGPEISNWTGSKKTKEFVAQQICQRYGEAELKNFDPLRTMLSWKNWIRLGFVPRKGEHAMKSYVIREVKDPATGEVIKTIYQKINLFYYRQVQEIGQKK